MISEDEVRHLRRVFIDLNKGHPISKTLEVLDFVALCYSEEHRFYHTLEHIAHGISELGAILKNSQLDEFQVKAIVFAMFFHDIVYDVKSSDNEFQSAGYAYEALTSIGWPTSFAGFVGDLICETAHKKPPASYAAKVLVDADLGILSDTWYLYLEYAKNVRCEYSYLDDIQWCNERIDFLERMLSMPHIYYTQPNLEWQASVNLHDELEVLKFFLMYPEACPLYSYVPASARI